MSENFKDQTKHGHIWNYSEADARHGTYGWRPTIEQRVRRESDARPRDSHQSPPELAAHVTV